MRDWSRADDLTQETLVRVYQRWRRVAAGHADAYARRVLTTIVIDESRRAWWRETPSDVVPDTAHVDPTGTDPTIVAALRQVPVGQRTVLVLRYWEDLTLAQTADVLGCSIGNAKSQAARGLARLRELLPEHDLSMEASAR